MTFSPSLVGLLACTRCIVTLFLALRPHTVHGYVHAATPTRFNITYARPRARKGCAIDQSLPWIFLQGPAFENTMVSRMIFSPSLPVAHVMYTDDGYPSPPPALPPNRPFFRLPFPVTRYTFLYLWEWESLIGK